MQLQRAVGQFDVLMTEAEREAYLNDMIKFVTSTTRDK